MSRNCLSALGIEYSLGKHNCYKTNCSHKVSNTSVADGDGPMPPYRGGQRYGLAPVVLGAGAYEICFQVSVASARWRSTVSTSGDGAGPAPGCSVKESEVIGVRIIDSQETALKRTPLHQRLAQSGSYPPKTLKVKQRPIALVHSQCQLWCRQEVLRFS
jgi:hypothetical protein